MLLSLNNREFSVFEGILKGLVFDLKAYAALVADVIQHIDFIDRQVDLIVIAFPAHDGGDGVVGDAVGFGKDICRSFEKCKECGRI